MNAIAAAVGFDAANLRAFTSAGGLRYYQELTGWLDPGEQALTEAAFERLDRPCTLDIGVGCGRTVPLLRDRSASYVAIDMASRMVTVTRRRCPGVDARIMDARRQDLADAPFDLVALSYNRLDGLPPRARSASGTGAAIAASGPTIPVSPSARPRRTITRS